MFRFNVLKLHQKDAPSGDIEKGSDWFACSFYLLFGRSLDKGKLGLDMVVLKHPMKDNSFVTDFKQSLIMGKEVST
jgi:hypothetical protein